MKLNFRNKGHENLRISIVARDGTYVVPDPIVNPTVGEGESGNLVMCLGPRVEISCVGATQDAAIYLNNGALYNCILDGTLEGGGLDVTSLTDWMSDNGLDAIVLEEITDAIDCTNATSSFEVSPGLQYVTDPNGLSLILTWQIEIDNVIQPTIISEDGNDLMDWIDDNSESNGLMSFFDLGTQGIGNMDNVEHHIRLIPSQSYVNGMVFSSENQSVSVDQDGIISFCLIPDGPIPIGPGPA